jgi:hypothetical protein
VDTIYSRPLGTSQIPSAELLLIQPAEDSTFKSRELSHKHRQKRDYMELEPIHNNPSTSLSAREEIKQFMS